MRKRQSIDKSKKDKELTETQIVATTSTEVSVGLSNEELNARLADILSLYGHNIQFLGKQVNDVNTRLGEVYKKVEGVNNALDDLRIDHLELKQVAKSAKSIREEHQELFEQKATLFGVTTHAITKVFDYVMYSQMFEYLGKEPVTLTGVNQGHINMSTKELTKKELPFALDYLDNEFKLDMAKFNNHLYKKYKSKINQELDSRYYTMLTN